MKKRWYLICLIFCLYLLINIPGNAQAKSNESILVPIGPEIVKYQILQNTKHHLIDAANDKSRIYLNKNSSHIINIPPETRYLTLVFKKHTNIKDTYLTDPSGKQYSLFKEDTGILATKNAEVIQIKYPIPGDWVLSGPTEQVEEILDFTHIKVGTNFISGDYFAGELIHFSVYLEQGIDPILSDLVTDGMEVNFTLEGKNHKFNYAIPYDKNGLFKNQLILNVPPGEYKAVWQAQSPYISKKYELKVNIKPLPFQLRSAPKNDALMIKMPHPDAVKKKSIKIQIFHNDKLQYLYIKNYGNTWGVSFIPLCGSPFFSEDKVMILITAQANNGRNLIFKRLLDSPLCSPNFIALPLTDEEKKEKEAELQKAREALEVKENKIHLKILVIGLVILLLLIAILSLFVWYRKRKRKNPEDLIIESD